MSLIVSQPEPNRIYTHFIERKYIYSNKQGREKQYRRIYIHSLDELKEYNATEADLIYSYFEFSLNPLLTERFWSALSLSDRLKLVYPATARNLWLLAIIEGLEVTSAAIKSCNSGTELVEITGRTVIEQKLQDLYIKRWSGVNLGPERCLVVNDNDDRVPSLPIYVLNNEELISFFSTCFGPCLYTENHPSIPSWTVIMKSRHFAAVWRWKNQVDIVPYCFLRRVVYDVDPQQPANTAPILLSQLKSKKEPLQTKRKKKALMLLQVVAVEPIQLYNSHWGTPINYGQSSFPFYIGEDKEEYRDNFESFYISNEHLSTFLLGNSYTNEQLVHKLLQTEPEKIEIKKELKFISQKEKCIEPKVKIEMNKIVPASSRRISTRLKNQKNNINLQTVHTI